MLSRRTLLAAGGAALAALAFEGETALADEARHVVLLGDSIFDNKVYVGAAPAVIDQVRAALGSKGKATLIAVDGDVAADVAQQIARMPADATHLIVSVGGNDALRNQDRLLDAAENVGHALLKLSEVQSAFAASYRAMLAKVMALGKPVAVCTIYDPNFDDPVRQRIARSALALFNDEILRAAFAAGIPVIDLRMMFTSRDHFANEIEPGPKGGEKIAREIARLVASHDFAAGRSVVYGRQGGA